MIADPLNFGEHFRDMSDDELYIAAAPEV